MHINEESSKFRPRGKSVLVQPSPANNISHGGIFLVRESQMESRPTFGKVVRVGEKVDSVSVGEEVYWTLADGMDFEFTDGKFILLREASLLVAR
jgi:co-chaperonin GroES (HSP10)